MKGLVPIFKRELWAYFHSPIAYVFIIIFLISNVGCTFLLGNFYSANQASLESFFLFHPWLYLLLIPQGLSLTARGVLTPIFFFPEMNIKKKTS